MKLHEFLSVAWTVNGGIINSPAIIAMKELGKSVSFRKK